MISHSISIHLSLNDEMVLHDELSKWNISSSRDFPYLTLVLIHSKFFRNSKSHHEPSWIVSPILKLELPSICESSIFLRLVFFLFTLDDQPLLTLKFPVLTLCDLRTENRMTCLSLSLSLHDGKKTREAISYTYFPGMGIVYWSSPVKDFGRNDLFFMILEQHQEDMTSRIRREEQRQRRAYSLSCSLSLDMSFFNMIWKKNGLRKQPR